MGGWLVLVGVKDQQGLIKRSGFASRTVKNCFELTGIGYGRFKHDKAVGKFR